MSLQWTVFILAVSCLGLLEIQGAAIDEPKAEAIIGGDTASKGEFPSFASIRRLSSFRCGGILIDEESVLTAKHCVSDSSPSQIKVTVGDYKRLETKDDPEEIVDVSSFIYHDSADLVILKLSCVPTLNQYVQVADLYTNPSLPVGTDMVAVGFGWTRSGDASSLADTLQKLTLPVASNGQCSQELLLHGGAGIRTHEFCVGDPSDPTYTNVCHGDSGGPIYHQATGELAGVVVRGPKYCPDTSNFAVSIKVSDMMDFINRYINGRNSVSACYVPPPPEDNGCFPGNAMVMTEAGLSKRMEEVRRGDRVLAMTPEGALVYSDVIMVMHSNHQAQEEFFIISTGDKAIRLTAKHMIYTKGKHDDKPTYKFAAKVQTGDFVFISENRNAEVIKAEVMNIEKAIQQGLFAPVTLEGTIVVDQVVASCYGYLESQATCHAVFYPARALHSWLPASLGWGEPADGATGEEDHLHWYPHLVAAVSSPALSVVGIKV